MLTHGYVPTRAPIVADTRPYAKQTPKRTQSCGWPGRCILQRLALRARLVVHLKQIVLYAVVSEVVLLFVSKINWISKTNKTI